MYKNILIPTDGSELSGKAIQHGVALAKALNAKVTAVTVSKPFHVFAIEPGMVTDTPESYAKRAAETAAKHLGAPRARPWPAMRSASSTNTPTRRSSIRRRTEDATLS